MVFFLRMNRNVPYTSGARGDGRWMTEALQVAPSLAGVCHGLRKGGPVLAQVTHPELRDDLK
jgi:hypothetical protein